MFQNPIYHIESVRDGDFTVSFDCAHRIFAAHFPGRPVLPGACIIEMARRLASEYYGAPLDIRRCRMVKFLKMIEPGEISGVVFSFRILSDSPDMSRISTTVRSADSSVIFSRLDMEYGKR